MPRVPLNDVEIYYEDTGSGYPVVFCHEFAADYRGWDPQVRAFGRSYRCITFSYRGFPPSSVPESPEAYSQDHLIEDLKALVNHMDIEKAHFVGFSMGGSVVLNFALRYPQLCRTIVVVGAGSGTTNREQFERDIDATVSLLRTRGIAGFAEVYGEGPTRLPFKRKDPHGYGLFRRQLAEHSATGQALTMLDATRNQLPDLIVADLAMPGDDGYALMDVLPASDAPLRSIPAIAVTAYSDEDHRRRAIEAGFRLHRAKPIPPDEVTSAVLEALGM